MSCLRTKIMCPACFKKNLMEYKPEFGDDEVWCDECGTEFKRVDENTVRYL